MLEDFPRSHFKELFLGKYLYFQKFHAKSETHTHFFGFGNVLRRFKDKDPAVLKLLENKKI